MSLLRQSSAVEAEDNEEAIAAKQEEQGEEGTNRVPNYGSPP